MFQPLWIRALSESAEHHFFEWLSLDDIKILLLSIGPNKRNILYGSRKEMIITFKMEHLASVPRFLVSLVAVRRMTRRKGRNMAGV